jgi:hypothetical protein
MPFDQQNVDLDTADPSQVVRYLESITPLAPLPPSSEVRSSTSEVPPLPRDRRAFSFPTIQSRAAQPVMAKDCKSRRSSNVLPPFARKPCLAATSLTSPVNRVDLLPLTCPLHLALGSVRTTGRNMPPFSDSVIGSTWESSDDEPDKPPLKPLAPIPRAPRASTSTTTLHAATPPDDCRFSTLRSQRCSAGFNTHLRTSQASHSPVAAIVASSASSRSREDIISWAKAVVLHPDARSSDYKDQPRGRSRTKRRETLAHLHPPSTELRDGHEEHDSTGACATSKRKIGSALAGLRMGGVAPIVNAHTSVTTTTAPAKANPPSPSPSQLCLQSVPAPAQISRVAVVATTSPGEDTHDATPAHSFGEAISPLSTISFSEVIERSVEDNHDALDIVMDGQSAASSRFSGRPSMPLKPRRPSYSPTVPAPVLERRRRNSLPLLPIATIPTATTMWNLSVCLRSFAPFSISSVVSPQPPFASVDPPDPALDSSTPSLVRSPPVPPVAPVPALRVESSREDAAPPVRDFFRSLPMDILPPHNGVGIEERRPPSVSTPRSRSGEKSVSQTRSASPIWDRPRSRSPSRSRDSVSLSRSSSAGIPVTPVHPYGRKWSYGAKGCEDDVEPSRGRSRVGKAVGLPKDLSASAYRDEGEPRRGRERATRDGTDAPGEVRGSAIKGRGRHRTVRAI